MQATEKKLNNKLWLSILSVGVVIALILGVVGIVNHNDTKSNAIPTINRQVANINDTLPELEKVSTELKGYTDTLETTVEKLQTDLAATNTAIASLKTELEGKISESEQKVLGELNTLKTNIEGQITALSTDIAALKAKDTELDGRITDLKTYVDTQDAANKTWANATFATLEQYNAVQAEISGIKESINTINADIEAIEKDIGEQIKAINKSIADLDAELAEKVTEITTGYTNAVAAAKTEITNAYTTAIKDAITKSEAAMKAWVTETLADGYYDIATIDAKLKAITDVAATDEELAAAVAEQKTALEQAKTDLTTAYEAAIETAINDYNGEITAKIAEDITAATSNLQSEIDAIKSEITSIKSRLDTLEKNFANRIQSLIFVPQYSDGKVLMDYSTRTTAVHLRISPASLAQLISIENVSAYARYTNDPTDRNGSGTAYEPEFLLSVVYVVGDEDDGTIAIKLKEDSGNLFSSAFWSGEREAVIYIEITDDNGNNIASEAIPMIAHAYGSIEGITIYDFNEGDTYTGEVTE